MAESFDTTAGFGEYLSHKRVKAAPIVRVVGQTLTLRLQGGTEMEIPAAPGMFARYTPEPGDLYVVYDDGYAAISPRQVFDEGYGRIGTDDGGGLDFAAALLRLKAGKRVARRGWNGKDMFLFLVPGSTFQVNRAPLLGIYPEGTTVEYHAHIDMKTAQGYVVPWLASQADLLSRDWIVLEEAAAALQSNEHGIGPDEPGGPNPDYAGEPESSEGGPI